MAHVVPLSILFAASLAFSAPTAGATTAAEHRRAVAALVEAPAALTPEALLHAHLVAGAADRLAPWEPWGQAARCDVARRWGDPRLTSACVAALAQKAPGHAETRRALALAAEESNRTGLLAGWALLGAAVIVSVRRAWRRSRRPALGAVLLASLLGAFPAPVTAAAGPPLEGLIIDDSNPESTVPSPAQRDANPLAFGYHLQELIARAAAASERGDHRAAVRYYRALAKAVPDRATAFGKLCAALEAAGDPPRAIVACRAALTLSGVTVEDFTRFVRLNLERPGQLAAAELAEIRSAVLHLQAQPEVSLAGQHLACELAIKANDLPLLERCSSALAARAPEDPKTISFQWALAIRQGDRARAEGLITRAEKAGLAAAGLERMKAATLALSSRWSALLDWRTFWRVFLGSAALLLLVLVAARRWRRPSTPATPR